MTVGVTAKLNVFVAKLAPSLGDKLSAKQADRQQYDEPPHRPHGTLNEPGYAGHERGSEARAASHLATRAETRRSASRNGYRRRGWDAVPLRYASRYP